MIQVIFYFLLSTILTWWFIVASPLYISEKQMLLSCGIAGSKWMMQLLAGFFLLKEKRWEFIKKIGFICFAGSVLLVPYCISSLLHWNMDSAFFIGSLVVSVISMIALYYKGVQECKLVLTWWATWLFCLAVAVILQLTVVFHVI